MDAGSEAGQSTNAFSMTKLRSAGEAAASSDPVRHFLTQARKNILFFLRTDSVALPPANPQESAVFRG
jgi:hypothetical protein